MRAAKTPVGGVSGVLRAVGTALAEAAYLATPYFRSAERRRAWGLLSVIIALNLVTIYLNVVYTYWYKVAYNALQTKTASAFWASMFTYRIVRGFPYVIPGFSEIAALAIVAGVYAFYLGQMLEIAWRRWLTLTYVERWLDRRTHYHLSLTAGRGTPLDNPDQRIADDVRSFVSNTLTLGVSLLSNVVTLLSFVAVLWAISPPLRFDGFVLPGYLLWAALLYSVVGTYFTNLIGHKLVPLTFQQQRVDADFRFNLVRVREHTEQIALYGGEQVETSGLQRRFGAIYENWRQIMKRTKALNFFTVGFTQVALIFPLVVAAPGYFGGVLSLGVVMQIVTIFGNVQGAFSWLVSSYPQLVLWRATVQRLDAFERAMRQIRRRTEASELDVATDGTALRLERLTVDLPDGRRLLDQDALVIPSGSPVALMGPSGAGKSTLVRVLAGIWPFARGRLIRPAGTMMFLPQRPYIPLGTLKAGVAYPAHAGALPDDVVRTALCDVGLEALCKRLHDEENWMLCLSGGEHQRLALARALLVAPDWLFLDEAMSALDEPEVERLFGVLRRRIPRTQIVSVVHRGSTASLHPRRAVVETAIGEAATAATRFGPLVDAAAHEQAAAL